MCGTGKAMGLALYPFVYPLSKNSWYGCCCCFRKKSAKNQTFACNLNFALSTYRRFRFSCPKSRAKPRSDSPSRWRTKTWYSSSGPDEPGGKQKRQPWVFSIEFLKGFSGVLAAKKSWRTGIEQTLLWQMTSYKTWSRILFSWGHSWRAQHF